MGYGVWGMGYGFVIDLITLPKVPSGQPKYIGRVLQLFVKVLSDMALLRA